MDFYDVMYDEGFTDPEEYMDFKMNEYMNTYTDEQSEPVSHDDDEEDIDFFDDNE